jgi:hypothetical protein
MCRSLSLSLSCMYTTYRRCQWDSCTLLSQSPASCWACCAWRCCGTLLAPSLQSIAGVERPLRQGQELSSRHLASHQLRPSPTPDPVKNPARGGIPGGVHVLLAHSFRAIFRQRCPGGPEQKIIVLHAQRFNDRECSIALTQPAETDILLALGRDEVIG